jgi:hypothetical protein
MEHPVPTIGNPELLKLVMKDIEADPERWDQDCWFKSGKFKNRFEMARRQDQSLADVNLCGTTACLAGHTLIREGYQPTNAGYFLSPEGRYISTEAVAEELLGLEEDQAHALFFYTKTSHIREDRGYDIDKPITLEEFKAHVTEVTGVTFD